MTPKQRGRLIAFLVITLIIAGIIFLFSWIITRGVVDTPQEQSENSSPSTSEPVETNPEETNIEGGTTGAGTGQNNTGSNETPSLPGGTDTNQRTTP